MSEEPLPTFTKEQVKNMLDVEDDESSTTADPNDPSAMDTSTGEPGTEPGTEDAAGERASTGCNTEPGPSTTSTGTSTEDGEDSRRRTYSASTSGTGTNGTGLPRAYANVRAARSDSSTVRPLYGSEVYLINDLGTFVSTGDNRTFLANHRHCYTTKANISTSFELDTMACNTCTFRGKHRVLRRETERPDTVDDSPIVFVLSDQCFPPVLSPEGEGECIKIMRIEDGRIMELLDAFIDATKGFVIPAGSVVVLCSASHLAALGTEAYAAEFSEAKFKE
jgi:hypothetical protein